MRLVALQQEAREEIDLPLQVPALACEACVGRAET